MPPIITVGIPIDQVLEVMQHVAIGGQAHTARNNHDRRRGGFINRYSSLCGLGYKNVWPSEPQGFNSWAVNLF